MASRADALWAEPECHNSVSDWWNLEEKKCNQPGNKHVAFGHVSSQEIHRLHAIQNQIPSLPYSMLPAKQSAFYF